jgi:hypothetical protein
LQADSIYGGSWKNVWTIPSVVISCESSSNCVTVSLSSEVAKVQQGSAQSLALTSEVTARLRREKALQRFANQVDRQAKNLHAKNLSELAELPQKHTTCAAGGSN